MATRQLHRLTALKIGKLDVPGHNPDGGNLYFQISETGSRSWIFKFTLSGRSCEMGLGPLASVSLAAARAEASRCRDLLRDGVDPIEARKSKQRQRMLEMSGPRLFKARLQRPTTSPSIVPAGRTRSTPSSGRTRSPPTQPPSLVIKTCATSTRP
nr:Arm DNA-binding domain-containing protein [Cupriavidus nantongensis]